MRACGCRAAMRWPPTVVCRRSHVCLLERVDTLIKVEDTVPSAHTLELQSKGCGAAEVGRHGRMQACPGTVLLLLNAPELAARYAAL